MAVSDDGELVVRLRAGDDDAFATLVGMYQTPAAAPGRNGGRKQVRG